MKKTLIFLMMLLVLPSILAMNLKVDKASSDEVLIIGLNNPAIFNLNITNLGKTDNFQFYNLMGFAMDPKGTFTISNGETKKIELKISPISAPENRGYYTLDYYIRASNGEQQLEKLTFKIVDLRDAFAVGSEEISPESNLLKIYILNKVNFNFGEISAKFSSAFFKIEKDFVLAPKEKQTFVVELNKEDIKKLMAGFYTLSADISVGSEGANVEGIIKFAEQDLVASSQKDYGFIINTETIRKANQGNTIIKSETIIKKNIFSRLFTSFSPEPDVVEREGAIIYYKWTREIKPGETLEIIVRTNWLFPLLVIFFIIVIIVLVRQHLKTNLVLRKTVSFVRAKGGEFALKVTITAHANKFLGKVKIIDRLPPLTKVYEKFSGEHPSKVDDKYKRLEWNFEKLDAGETRLISYIIYSKIGVLGRFALPSAVAIFERNGQINESVSNRAFFVTEQRERKIEEEG